MMKCDKKLTNRLKRLEGQIKAVIKLSEQDTLDCPLLTTQLKAIKGATEQAIAYITVNNLKQAIQNNLDLDESLALISKNIT